MPDYRESQLNLTAGRERDKTAGSSMPAFAPRRFQFITGKGGVGKTTVTAALARSLSARGLRVLVTVCGSKERLGTLLGAPPVALEHRAARTEHLGRAARLRSRPA